MATEHEIEIEIEAAESIARTGSRVKPEYKRRYAEREAAMARRPKGVSRRVLARCNGDWLAIELAKRVLGEKDRLQLPDFHAILEANGIDPARWAKLNPGQQRMCGGLALRAVVAEAEELELPGEPPLVPPRSWLAKHQR